MNFGWVPNPAMSNRELVALKLTFAWMIAKRAG
jgi:hypothetical protein